MSDPRDRSHPIDRLPDLLLGELSEADADRTLRHVAACPTCAEAWAELERSTLALSEAQPRQDPPPAVRARLMARVHADAERRGRRRKVRPVAQALAGAAAVAAGAALWLAVVQPRQEATALGQRVAILAGAGQSRGDVYIDASIRKVTVRVWHLPPLGQGRVYEVWWVHGRDHMMGGCFGVDSQGDATVTLALPAGWQKAAAVGVTAEPAPGTARPTSPRVVGGSLAKGLPVRGA